MDSPIPPDGPTPTYRSVFISDLHLGSAQCRVDELSQFLAGVNATYIYLVGDVVDAWVGGSTTRWKPGQERALLSLLEKASPSCKVRYTPGNHDAVMRRFIGIKVFSTEIQHSFIHETVDGRRFLVVHGDLFDKFVTTYKPIAWFLAWMHEITLGLNHYTNLIGAKFGRKPSNYGRDIKRKVKSITERATGFENLLAAEARRQDVDGVICGHIHKPKISILEGNTMYVNTGDWVEHCSFVVEHWDGSLELRSFPTETKPQTSESGESLEYRKSL
ncbi:UDP-2,3-diacylglucosamine hydrolase [Fimbriimonadaceae bacterium]